MCIKYIFSSSTKICDEVEHKFQYIRTHDASAMQRNGKDESHIANNTMNNMKKICTNNVIKYARYFIRCAFLKSLMITKCERNTESNQTKTIARIHCISQFHTIDIFSPGVFTCFKMFCETKWAKRRRERERERYAFSLYHLIYA